MYFFSFFGPSGAGGGVVRCMLSQSAGALAPSGVYKPVAPVAYQVILEPGIGQFRDRESPRVHTRIHS